MIDILLATYNGEKYVKAQILSILSQSFTNWHLYVHDDGRTDNTILIVKELAELDNRIFIIEDDISCGNAASNFMHLLKYSKSPYVMFCDQDDIWFDNKVEIMFNSIKSIDKSMPSVLYTNAYVWHPMIGILGKATLTFPSDINSLLFLNSGIQGCVSIFNAKMRELMLQWNGSLAMHDHLLHLLGCSLGTVIYNDIPLMLYRKHANNVTGSTKTNKNNIRSILSSINHPIICRKHYDVVVEFRSKYDDVLNSEVKHFIDEYIKLPNKTFISKVFSIVKNRFKCYDSVLRILIKMIIKPYIK